MVLEIVRGRTGSELDPDVASEPNEWSRRPGSPLGSG